MLPHRLAKAMDKVSVTSPTCFLERCCEAHSHWHWMSPSWQRPTPDWSKPQQRWRATASRPPGSWKQSLKPPRLLLFSPVLFTWIWIFLFPGCKHVHLHCKVGHLSLDCLMGMTQPPSGNSCNCIFFFLFFGGIFSDGLILRPWRLVLGAAFDVAEQLNHMWRRWLWGSAREEEKHRHLIREGSAAAENSVSQASDLQYVTARFTWHRATHINWNFRSFFSKCIQKPWAVVVLVLQNVLVLIVVSGSLLFHGSFCVQQTRTRITMLMMKYSFSIDIEMFLSCGLLIKHFYLLIFFLFMWLELFRTLLLHQVVAGLFWCWVVDCWVGGGGW